MDQPESSEDGLQPQDLSSATCALPIVFDLSRKADDCLLKANAVDTLHVVQPPGWFVGTAAAGGGGSGGTSDAVTFSENPCDLSPVPCDQIQPDNAFSNTTVTLSYVSRSHVFPSSTTPLAPHCSLIDVSSLSKKLSQHASGYEALPLPLVTEADAAATATATATAQLCVGMDPHCLQPVSAPIEVDMGVGMSPDSFDFMLPAQVVQNVATGVCFLKHAATVDLHTLQDAAAAVAAAGGGGGGDAGGAAAVEILTPLQQDGGPIVCKLSPPQENGCLANGDCGALWGPVGACGVGIGVGVGIEAVGVGIDGVAGLGVDVSGLTSGGLFASTAEVVQGGVERDPDLLFLISRNDQPLVAAHDIRTSRSLCSVLEREYVSPLEDPVSPPATPQDEIEGVFVLPQTAGSPTGDRFPDDADDLMANRDADLGFCDASSPAMLACNSDQECLSVDSNTELISATELNCQAQAVEEVVTTYQSSSEQCQEENRSEKAHNASGKTKSHELTTTNTHQVNGDAPAKNRVPERKILPPRTGRGIRLEAIVQNINPYRWRVSTQATKTKSTKKKEEKAPENKDATLADKGLSISEVIQQTCEGTQSPKKSPRLKEKASEYKEEKVADKRVLHISDVVPETCHNTRSLKRSPCSKQKVCERKVAEGDVKKELNISDVVPENCHNTRSLKSSPCSKLKMCESKEGIDKEANISDVVPENCHNTRSKTKSPCWKQKVFESKDAKAGDKTASCVSALAPEHCGNAHPIKEESSTSLQTIVPETVDDADSSSYSRERSTSDSHKHTKSLSKHYHKKGAPDKKKNRQNIITTQSTPTSFVHTSSKKKKKKKKSEKKSPSRTLDFKSSSSTHPAPSSPSKSPRAPSIPSSTHPAPSTPSKSPRVHLTPIPTVSSKSPSPLKKSHKKNSENHNTKHQPETIFTPSKKPQSGVTQSKTSSPPAAATTIQTTVTAAASKKAPTTKTKRKKHKVASGHSKSSMFSPKEPEIKLKYVNYREEKRDSGRADPIFSPFVHVEVKGYSTCTVINYPEEDTVSSRKRHQHHQQQQSSSSYITGVVPSTPSLTYGRVSMAAARRAALVCCLCGRSANALDLGDLHGPYYAEGYKADSKAAAGGSRSSSSGGGGNGDPELGGGDVGVGVEVEEDLSDSDSSFGTRNRKFRSGGTPGSWSRRARQWRPSDQPGSSSLVAPAGGCWAIGDDDSGSGISGIEPLHSPMSQHYSPAAKRMRMDTSSCSMESWLTAPVLPLDPHEYWLHEDCGIWSAGVFLVKGKLYGLERAVKMAQETVCSTCHKLGATLGCFFRECPNKYHYICAIQSNCVLNEENFSMKCTKHKNKSIKGSTNRKTAR